MRITGSSLDSYDSAGTSDSKNFGFSYPNRTHFLFHQIALRLFRLSIRANNFFLKLKQELQAPKLGQSLQNGGFSMSKKNFKSLVLGVLFLALAPFGARAEVPFDYRNLHSVEWLRSDIFIRPGETKSFSLGNWRFVKKVFIQAEANQQATIEVLVNGDVKGTVLVPGNDPSYVVTLGESLQSLELRHVQGGGVRISSILALQSEEEFVEEEFDLPFNAEHRNEASDLAIATIRLVDQLEPFTNHSDYGVYLLPIKKAAARTYAKSIARGVLSREVRNSLYGLKAEITLARAYISDTFERDAAFALSVELLAMREKLDHILR